jgi:parallel beta-helix repeat protein
MLTTVNDLGDYSTFYIDEHGTPQVADSQGHVTLKGAIDYVNYMGEGEITIGIGGVFDLGYRPEIRVSVDFVGNGTASTLSIDFTSSHNTLENVNGSIEIVGDNNAVSQSSGFIYITGSDNSVSFGDGPWIVGDRNTVSNVTGYTIVGGNDNRIEHSTGRVDAGGARNVITDHHGEVHLNSSDSFATGNFDGDIFVEGDRNQIVGNASSRVLVTGNENQVTNNELSEGISVTGDDNDVTNNVAGGASLKGSRNLLDDNTLAGGVGVQGADNTISNNEIFDAFIGIELTGSETTGNLIVDNTIDGSSDNGIFIWEGAGYGNRIEHNIILNNGWHGIEIQNPVNNVIVNNIIAGNSKVGLILPLRPGHVSAGNVIDGNWIGVDAMGNRLSNGLGGILSQLPGTGNTIIRNVATGISLSNETNSLIKDNRVGTDPMGLMVIGGSGISIYGTGNRLTGNRVSGASVGGISVGGSNNTVGGTQPGDGNTLTENAYYGVQISGNNNRVQGNYIGTDAAGTALGNGWYGVWIFNASDNIIGGSQAGAGNVICANKIDGIFIQGEMAARNRVEGNYIGTNADGASGLGNEGNGVRIVDASDNLIGGEEASSANVIGGNGTDDGIVAVVAAAAASTSTANGSSAATSGEGAGGTPPSTGSAVWIEARKLDTAQRNVIKGNFIGITKDNTPRPNGGNGSSAERLRRIAT